VQLAKLATNREDKNAYAQKALEYAKDAEKIAKSFKGTYSESLAYNSLWIALYTKSELEDAPEERIKVLKEAVHAAEGFLENPIVSLAGAISARLRLGDLYTELGIVSKDEIWLRDAINSYSKSLKQSEERGYAYTLALSHLRIARAEDRLGNHISSSDHYTMAHTAFQESLKTTKYESLRDKIGEWSDYARAWSLIETARVHHSREEHLNARGFYEEACEILRELPMYRFESVYYSSWALLEEAEHFGMGEMHGEAIDRYELARESFDNAMKTLEDVYKRLKEERERERVGELKKAAKSRMDYCSARISVERGRILGMQGKHFAAAEQYGCAASLFKDILNVYGMQKEREELMAIHHLCNAWKSMELAEKYREADRFKDAASLFEKACELFTESRMRQLASGNSAFCRALEFECEFDESIEIEKKRELYAKIKMSLRNAASFYRYGGFESGADWALATSTYFDAVWHLLRADDESDITERQKLFDIASGYLGAAAELFRRAGYKYREEEVLEQLGMVERESDILTSALSTIKKPSILESSVGIVAPACPVETSASASISEVRGYAQAVKKYEIVYKDIVKEGVQREKCRVAVAQMTSNILSGFYKEKSGLFELREEKLDVVKSSVKNMIDKAHKNKVDIIIFPELTIDLKHQKLLDDILNLAETYEMYVIPGSYHDLKAKRNVCTVIGPDGILWEQEKHIPSSILYKGRRIEEGITRRSTPWEIIVCNTEFGRIAIVICRDFLDMDIRVELKNFEPPVDMIFNPAFTPVTTDFDAAHFDARRSIYAYCFFANVAEFGDSLIHTPEKERIERKIPRWSEDLIYKDVDVFKLRSERKKWEKEGKQFIQSTRRG
jgi:predicted amidohydrolase/tetratricopeptide (TPR) repeat protein